MTQRTGINQPPTQPPKRPLAEPTINPDADQWKAETQSGFVPLGSGEDLGLRPEDPYQPDPTGFEPNTNQRVSVGGRTSIPLSGKDLEELHFRHAGSNPMVLGATVPNLTPEQLASMTDEEKQRRAEMIGNQQAMERERLRQAEMRQAQVGRLEDELLKGYSVNPNAVPPPPTIGPPVNAPAYFGADTTSAQTAPTQTTPMPSTIVDVGEGAKLLEALVNRASEARSRGDLKLATELGGMVQQVLLATNLKRTQPPKGRHPALQKLLSNLGLERIKPVDIEWLGTKWRFAPRPEALDSWIADNMGDGGQELNHALLSAAVVGLDDAPLYKVFNIPLSAVYTLTNKTDGDETGTTTTISVPAYNKVCESCGGDTAVDAEVCQTCGALQDIFDVPLELRYRYAILIKRFLMEKLCLDATQLRHLVDAMRKEMKDRRLDGEDLYPLLRLLPKEEKKKTTPG